MLLVSPQWSKAGYYLRWDARGLYSERWTEFSDTDCVSPSPSNASAETLSVSDIPSSRCLFLLRLSERHTGVTASSSSPMIGTATTSTGGYRSARFRGKKNPNPLDIVHDFNTGKDLTLGGLLPTPQAMDGTEIRGKMGKNDVLVQTESGLRRKVQTGSDFGVSLGFMANNALLPTQRTCSAMGASLDTEGNLEGNRCPNLETVVGRMLLPTPLAVDIEHRERTEKLKATGVQKFHSRINGESRPNGLMDYLRFTGMLPTPSAMEVEKANVKYNPNSQGGKGLFALAANGMLPTPTARDEKNPSSPDGERIARKVAQGYTIELNDLAAMGQLPTPSARDYEGKTNPGQVKEGSGCIYGETLPDTIDRICSQKTDGQNFRLSPLFTEEMMGFPLMWTTLPFLSQNGAPNLSRPTGTP